MHLCVSMCVSPCLVSVLCKSCTIIVWGVWHCMGIEGPTCLWMVGHVYSGCGSLFGDVAVFLPMDLGICEVVCAHLCYGCM
jgi:hypothetical protein